MRRKFSDLSHPTSFTLLSFLSVLETGESEGRRERERFDERTKGRWERGKENVLVGSLVLKGDGKKT